MSSAIQTIDNGQIIYRLNCIRRDRNSTYKTGLTLGYRCKNNNLCFLMHLGDAYVGEFLHPGYDCSDILDKEFDADDGFYWINLGVSTKRKVSLCKL